MQTVIAVYCNERTRFSLRDRIVNDTRLERYDLVVATQHKPGRNPGWAKLRSAAGERGVINLEWDGAARTLMARVISRSRRPPAGIVGQFTAYLLDRHRKGIRSIIVLPS